MQTAEVERVSVTPQYRLAPVKVTQRVHVYLFNLVYAVTIMSHRLCAHATERS